MAYQKAGSKFEVISKDDHTLTAKGLRDLLTWLDEWRAGEDANVKREERRAKRKARRSA